MGYGDIVFQMVLFGVLTALGVMNIIMSRKMGRPVPFFSVILIGMGAYLFATTAMRIPDVRAFNAAAEQLPADMPNPRTTAAGLSLDTDQDGKPVPKSVLYIRANENGQSVLWKAPVTMKGGNPVVGAFEVVQERK